ncbi:MAG TPA: lipoyl synthase [Acidimicrobiales bacterium]|nr:lipoyl synthase [Acidimicrobiales bacterium]
MLRVRWLGRVPYGEAHAVQRALHARTPDDHLLLLEHPDVFTLGVHGDARHVLVDPGSVGATVVRTDRGGDVTYHGPGQVVGYPIVSVPMGPGAIPGHVHAVEQLVIDVLAELGLAGGRHDGYPGVWVDADGPRPRKICAIGVRVSRGRSMHGLALNVDPDMRWFDRIIPCGLRDKEVTSLAAEGIGVGVPDVVELLARHGALRWAPDGMVDRQDVVSSLPRRSESLSAGSVTTAPGAGGRLRIRLRQAGVDPDGGLPLAERKPRWLRVPARMGDDFLALRRTMRDLDLVTVCEEAGCPNIFECWADGTATFMINGERCTRACGFCLVDTSHPLAVDPDEPERVADAVERLGLLHAVVTAVARDDLADGGASGFVATIEAIRRRSPRTAVEVLVPDCKGDPQSIDALTGARPDVFNHNLETVARLQRAVRPSAGYARSLAVLARAKSAGLTVKSGLILGMGECEDEVVGALADLRGVGVDIVTLGQYLRPSAAHLPVARWWVPEEFDRLREIGEAMGFAHVQASPLTRSSYHARAAAASARTGSGSGSVTGVLGDEIRA